jgi:hypothetical protein
LLHDAARCYCDRYDIEGSSESRPAGR